MHCIRYFHIPADKRNPARALRQFPTWSWPDMPSKQSMLGYFEMSQVRKKGTSLSR